MKSGRRALGSVFQRSEDDRWVVRVTLPTGKRLTRYAPIGAGRADAEQLLATLLTSPDLAPPAPYTVESWLTEHLTRANRGRAGSTIRDRKYLAVGINRTLGRVRLDKLTSAQVQAWADALTGSTRTRMKSVQLLRGALNEAVALGHIPRNPALPIRMDKQPWKPVGRAWTQDEARLFLQINEGTAQVNLWRLGLQTGARIGELLALRIEDYDRARGTLRIERTVKAAVSNYNRVEVGPPKTDRSRRVIHLPPDARQTVEAQLTRVQALRGAKEWQAEEGWLFPSEVGTLLSYRNTHRAWGWALDRVQAHLNREHVHHVRAAPVPQFPRLRMHDMRDTFISLACRRGVKPEVVSRIVGHTSPTITLRVYRQVYDDEFTEARDQLGNLY